MYDLTKLALNAQSARSMAKEVGLFPEGNWKWGLRNLRDGRGNPLQGRELQQAKQNLGSLSNNEYNQIQAAQRKAKNSNIEVMGDFDTTNKMNGVIQGGEGYVEIPDRHYPNKRSVHTHPEADFPNILGRLKKEREKINEHIKPKYEALFGKDHRFMDDLNAQLKEYDRFETGVKGINVLKGTKNPLYSTPSGSLTADAGGDQSFFTNRLIKRKGQPIHDSIVQPLSQIEGVHRTRVGPGHMPKQTSLFFDRSPRKGRE